MTRPYNIVVGQRVTEPKAMRAWQLRRQMTAEESVLWQSLRRNQMAGLHLRRQQIIGGIIVDFYGHAAALVVEVDGAWHGEEQQSGYDAERDRVIGARGIRTLRVQNEDVCNDLPAVIERIAMAAARQT